MMHGQGCEQWADGTVYNGEFTNGKKGPVGEMRFPDGNIYAGEFKENMLHG